MTSNLKKDRPIIGTQDAVHLKTSEETPSINKQSLRSSLFSLCTL